MGHHSLFDYRESCRLSGAGRVRRGCDLLGGTAATGCHSRPAVSVALAARSVAAIGARPAQLKKVPAAGRWLPLATAGRRRLGAPAEGRVGLPHRRAARWSEGCLSSGRSALLMPRTRLRGGIHSLQVVLPCGLWAAPGPRLGPGPPADPADRQEAPARPFPVPASLGSRP